MISRLCNILIKKVSFADKKRIPSKRNRVEAQRDRVLAKDNRVLAQSIKSGCVILKEYPPRK